MKNFEHAARLRQLQLRAIRWHQTGQGKRWTRRYALMQLEWALVQTNSTAK